MITTPCAKILYGIKNHHASAIIALIVEETMRNEVPRGDDIYQSGRASLTGASPSESDR